MADETGGGGVGVKLFVDDSGFSAGVKRAQATLNELPKSVQKNAQEFEKFGKFAQNAGNQLGLGIGGGAIQAGKALQQAGGAFQSYITATYAATAASGAFTKAQLNMAVASKVGTQALAAIGGPVGLVVIGGIMAIGKAYDWSKSREEKWTESQIKHFEEVGAAADKARDRITKAIVQQKELDRDARNAQGQLSAFQRGGADGLALEKQRQEIADKTRQAIIAIKPEWARFDDAVIRTHENYDRIHKAISATVTATAQLAKAQKDVADAAQTVVVGLTAQSQVMVAGVNAVLALARNSAVQDMLGLVGRFNDAWNSRGQTPGSKPMDPDKLAATRANTAQQTIDRLNESAEKAQQEWQREADRFADAIAYGIETIVGELGSGAISIDRGARAFAAGIQAFIGAIGGPAAGAVLGLINAQKKRFQEWRASVEAEVAALKSSEAYRDGIIKQGMSFQEAKKAADEYSKKIDEQREAQQRAREEASRSKERQMDLNLELERARARGNEDILREIDNRERLAGAHNAAERALIQQIILENERTRALEAQRAALAKWIVQIDDWLRDHGFPDTRGDKIGPIDKTGGRGTGGTDHLSPDKYPWEKGPRGGVKDFTPDTTTFASGGEAPGPSDISRSLATLTIMQGDRVISGVFATAAAVRSFHSSFNRATGQLGAAIDQHADQSDTREASRIGTVLI